MMAAGLRATAKVVEHPPEPNVGAPVLDPTRIPERTPSHLPSLGLLVISLKLRPPKPGHAVSPATLTGSAQIVRFPSQCYSLTCTEVAASSMSLVVSFGYDM
jgi:hypothetical protein